MLLTIANDRLIPALKAALHDDVVANGFSCRSQILDLAERQALTVPEILAHALQ